MALHSQPTTPRIRDSLLARADRVAVFPLTLVVAPAGSGKSTLLGAWRRRLAELGEVAVYLDLSPLHADAAVLCADLVEVLRRAAPGFGAETTRALASSRDDAEEWRVLLRAFLRDWRSMADGVLPVLDNFHEIANDGSGARFVDEMLRAQVAGLHLVIASRGATPEVTARLRAAGAVQEVEAAELSLRFDEVERVLAEQDVSDDADLTARVLARTGGWATGVQLAARRLARIAPAARAEFVAQLGREPDLFGFVAAEVLRDEPEGLLAAVEAVAVLGPCTADDVVALREDPNAAEWVARALQRGVLRAEGDEISLHQLWRDLIRERFRARHADAARRPVLRRAGSLLRARRNFEGALEAFAEAGDSEAMMHTVIAAAGPWAREGRAERLRYWLGRLPDGLVDGTPVLLALSGIALLRSAPQQALPILERAAQMFRARGDREHERTLAGYIGILHLAQLRRGDALRALRRIITLRGIVTSPAERGSLYCILAQRRFLMGRFSGALAMAERAARLPLDAPTDWFNAMLLSWLRAARGELDAGFAEIDRIARRPEIGNSGFMVGASHLQRARLHLLAGSPAQGLEEAERGEAAFRDHRIAVLRESAPTMIAYAKSRLGDREGARHWFERTLARVDGSGAAEGPARAHFAVELLRWGERDEARREAQRAIDTLGKGGERWSALTPWLLYYALWALGRSGETDLAWKLAQRHAGVARNGDLGLAQHTMLLIHAEIAQRAGDSDAAERAARQAFEYAVRFGARGIDPVVGDLLTPAWAEWAVRQDVCPEFALDRLAATAPARVPALLQEMVRDRSTETRERAVRLLARRGGRAAFEALRDASQDRVARVRDAASAALTALDLRPHFALRVASLGRFEVSRDDEPVTGDAWKGQTARRLFAHLLAAEGRAVARERLREELWPEAEPEAGRNNLRVAITRLNDALDPARPPGATPHFVVTDGDALRLHPDALADWDAARFRALLRDADAAERAGDDAAVLARTCEAVAAYGGPLLPELDDPPVLALRSELAERFVAAAHRLGPRLLRRGRLDEVGALANQLLSADPADERAHALRMRAQLARGDRAAALRSYDEAVAALRRELALDPGAELEQLAARARTPI